MTDTQDYQRLHEIFAAVCELAAPEREAELARRCGDDEALRQQVEALLRYHKREDDFLDRPVVAPGLIEPGAVFGESLIPLGQTADS